MATREQVFADFYRNFSIADSKLQRALEAVAEGKPVTLDALETLWYSKEISWLRNGMTPKEKSEEE